MTMIMRFEKSSQEVKIRARHVIMRDNYPKKTPEAGNLESLGALIDE